MMTLTLIFSDEETDKVKSIITDVRGVRYISSTKVAITELNGQRSSIEFSKNEKLEVLHREMERR